MHFACEFAYTRISYRFNNYFFFGCSSFLTLLFLLLWFLLLLYFGFLLFIIALPIFLLNCFLLHLFGLQILLLRQSEYFVFIGLKSLLHFFYLRNPFLTASCIHPAPDGML